MGAVIHQCDVEPDDLGPLLLGQLAPGRAREVARRVAACPLCAAEAADLAPVVAALRAYPPPDAQLSDAQFSDAQLSDAQVSDAQVLDTQSSDAQLSDTRSSDTQVSGAGLSGAGERGAGPERAAGPPRTAGLESVLAGVRAERRRTRWRAVAVAAAAGAVLALGASAVRLLPDGVDRPAPAAVDVRLAGQDGSSGRAVLDERGWGTAIRFEASGLDPAARYGVWLATEDGGRLPAGSFRPTAGGSVDLRLSAALPLASSRVLGVSRLPAAAGGQPVDVLEARLTG